MASESDVCLRTNMYYAAVACFVGYVVLEGVLAQKHPERNAATIILQVVQMIAIAFVMNLPNLGTYPFFEEPRDAHFPVGASVALAFIVLQGILSFLLMFLDIPVPLFGPLAGLVLGTVGNVIDHLRSESSACPGNTLHKHNYVDTLVYILIGFTAALMVVRVVKTATGGWQRLRLPAWFKSSRQQQGIDTTGVSNVGNVAHVTDVVTTGPSAKVPQGVSNVGASGSTADAINQVPSDLQELVANKSAPVYSSPDGPIKKEVVTLNKGDIVYPVSYTETASGLNHNATWVEIEDPLKGWVDKTHNLHPVHSKAGKEVLASVPYVVTTPTYLDTYNGTSTNTYVRRGQKVTITFQSAEYDRERVFVQVEGTNGTGWIGKNDVVNSLSPEGKQVLTAPDNVAHGANKAFAYDKIVVNLDSDDESSSVSDSSLVP